MINQFITDFRNSSYYAELLKCDSTKTILGIYIAGSVCTGLADQDSDFDIVILTLNGECRDVSDEFYLKYKRKKVHWYYFPIRGLFNFSYPNGKDLTITCPAQFKNFSPELTLFTNHNYQSLLNLLFINSSKISKLAIYKFYDLQKTRINKLLAQNTILEEDKSKFIYQLCLYSSYLRGEALNRTFLKELKRISTKPISESTKDLAIASLRLGLDFIRNNPLNYEAEAKQLFLTVRQKFNLVD